jgi:hypothetical protein
MRHFSMLVLAAPLMLLAGCSSSKGSGGSTTSGSATINGTFNVDNNGTPVTETLVAKDAIVASQSGGFGIIIGDYSGICAVGFANTKASSNVLTINTMPGLTLDLAAGTFSVGTDLEVAYTNFDSSCGSPYGETATGGTVVITSVGADNATGTFDITLNTDHITGSFDAAMCANTSSDAGVTCVP